MLTQVVDLERHRRAGAHPGLQRRRQDRHDAEVQPQARRLLRPLPGPLRYQTSFVGFAPASTRASSRSSWSTSRRTPRAAPPRSRAATSRRRRSSASPRASCRCCGVPPDRPGELTRPSQTTRLSAPVELAALCTDARRRLASARRDGRRRRRRHRLPLGAQRPGLALLRSARRARRRPRATRRQAVANGAVALLVERELPELRVPQIVLRRRARRHGAARRRALRPPERRARRRRRHRHERQDHDDVAARGDPRRGRRGRAGCSAPSSAASAAAREAAGLTTPEAPDLQRSLRCDARGGRRGLRAWRPPRSRSRSGGSSAREFAAVGFTNLSQDHLDFHGDLETLLRRQGHALRRALPARGQRRRRLRRAARRRAALRRRRRVADVRCEAFELRPDRTRAVRAHAARRALARAAPARALQRRQRALRGHARAAARRAARRDRARRGRHGRPSRALRAGRGRPGLRRDRRLRAHARRHRGRAAHRRARSRAGACCACSAPAATATTPSGRSWAPPPRPGPTGLRDERQPALGADRARSSRQILAGLERPGDARRRARPARARSAARWPTPSRAISS